MPWSANETAVSTDELSLEQIVESMIQRSNQIATLPTVSYQIIRLCSTPNPTLEDLNQVIAIDPVLGIRILRLVNSVYYGMQCQIRSIRHAILMLGPKSVKNIAVAASLVKLVRGGFVCLTFDAEDLWTHSVAVATAAQMLAELSGLVTTDEAFLGGLIHDVGIVVEMQSDSPHFAQVIEKLETDPTLSFRMAEEAILGISHESFGRGLCKHWNLPLSLQLSTGYHHRPWELPELHRRLPTLIHIADILAAKVELGYTRTVETDSVDLYLLGCVNLTRADLSLVAHRLPDAMKESQRLLSGDAK